MDIPKDLPKFGEAMNRCEFKNSARHCYELMSGALIWEDEKPDVTHNQLGYLRMIWAFRTGEILGKRRPEFQELWDVAREVAPQWPGFKPDRIAPPQKTVDYLITAKQKSDRQIDRWDKACSGEWKPLSGEQPQARAEQAGDGKPNSVPSRLTLIDRIRYLFS